MNQLFQYIPANSITHHLDPRVKILSLIVFGLLIFQAGPVAILLLGLFLALTARFSGLSRSSLIHALRPLRYFFLLLFLVHLFFTVGQPIEFLPSRPFTITYEGLYQGLITASQFLMLIVATSIMTMTTSPGMMVSGLEKLLGPFEILRLPVHDIAMMISIALNFVPLILGEIEKVKEAQSARGAHFESRSPIKRIQLFLNLFVPVCLNTFRKADGLVMAMEGRGYRRGPRSLMRKLKLTRNDYLALVLITITVLIFMAAPLFFSY